MIKTKIAAWLVIIFGGMMIFSGICTYNALASKFLIDSLVLVAILIVAAIFLTLGFFILKKRKWAFQFSLIYNPIFSLGGFILSVVFMSTLHVGELTVVELAGHSIFSATRLLILSPAFLLTSSTLLFFDRRNFFKN